MNAIENPMVRELNNLFQTHFAPRKIENDTDCCDGFCGEKAVIKYEGKRYCAECANDFLGIEVLRWKR